MAFGENFLCAAPIKKTKNEGCNSFSRTISKKMVYQWGNQNLYGCEMLRQARFTTVSQQPGLKDSRLELKKEKALNLNVKCNRHLFYSISIMCCNISMVGEFSFRFGKH